MTNTNHLSEDDLVLHYYGELEPGTGATAAEQHLAGCAKCRDSFVKLQRVLAAVDALPEPALPNGFERTVWARLEPSLAPQRNWLSWFVLSPARLAWASAILVLISAAFFAGRLTHRDQPAGTVVSAEQLRERVLLADLGEHLDRSQMMLVDLVSADAEAVDMSAERKRAEELVAANRLYRQTAAATGEARIGELLDELERLLVELAASPDQLSAEETDRIRQRIDANGILFKVRVLSTTVRERQKQQTRARGSQSS